MSNRPNGRRWSLRSIWMFVAGLFAVLGFDAFNKQRKEQQASQQGSGPNGHTTEAQAQFEESVRVGHEFSDVKISGIMLTGVVIAGSVVFFALVLWGFFAVLENDWRQAQDLRTPLLATPQIPPEPRLQANPSLDWAELQAAELELLNEYGWVDQDAQIVRVPIERAIEIVAAEGLPSRDGPVPDFEDDPAVELDSEGGQELVPVEVPDSLQPPQPSPSPSPEAP